MEASVAARPNVSMNLVVPVCLGIILLNESLNLYNGLGV